MSRLSRRILATVAVTSVVAALVHAPAAQAAGPNLAAGKTFSASSSTDVYSAGNAGDSNPNTYWESNNNAFPQWLQVDLGTSTPVNQAVLKLPPATAWNTRTETLSIQGSTDGTAFSTLKASAGYTFNPSSGNTVTIDFTAASARFVRLNFTGNTAWPAGQLSELEIYGPVSGDGQAPSAPGGLAYTTPASGQIRLTWNASTDNVGVTGYDVYANGVLRTSLGNVLTWTDSQPDSATVAYHVRARDAAGNVSGTSNTVTRNGTPQTGANLAAGKPIEASSVVHTFVAANANDSDTATYWEGGAYPANLTVKLGANATVSSVVVKLNPATAWGTRQQTFSILGREQSASAYTTIAGSATYTFNPSTQNTVTVPVSATTADVRLSFTANTGAPSGQVAEFQVIGAAAANPDLTVTSTAYSPAAPVETDTITTTATVRNAGTAPSAASNVNFYLGTAKAGTVAVPALTAGQSQTVSVGIGARDAGSYQLSAKVDEAGAVVETNEANNTWTHPSALVVTPVSSADLVASAVTWNPGTPAAGTAVAFSVTLKNQGSAATSAGAHGVTLTILNGSTTVRTLTASYTGTLAAGASTVLNLGSWTAANGRYTVRTVVAVDSAELPVKQANNTAEKPFFVGRGANLPFDFYEAEDGQTGGGAAVVGPNRIVGNLAGEASGRKAVTLNQTGSYVQWTTRAATNTVVTRFSIPDGTTSSINVYVNGSLNRTMPLTSKYAWLYGNEANPQNSGTGPRHIYDEANILLTGSFPAGSTIKLQKDAGNTGSIAIDFINLEQVAALGNPDPSRYVVPTGFDQQSVQAALDAARQDTSKLGVYLPAGDYQTSNKFQVYGRSVKVVGAGPWYTRFHTPSTQTETDAGFRADATANGSTFANFAFFGNYTIRIDGPGKVFDLANVADITIDNIWAEHVVCLYWGANTDNMVIRNSRIRNTFADGVNMTNGSTGNLVDNNEARATGDDSFALFSAIDAGGSDEINNTYSNLTSILTWRAAGIAVYGGYANTFKNIYIADTLVYSGITISSLDFGYPMNGFGANPPTVFDNISIVRAGGHFWGAQVFPAIWLFSASKVFQGIRVSNVDIVDPTYSGIMFQTQYLGGQPVNPIKDTVFTNVTITGAQRSGDEYDAKSGYAIWANPLPEAGQGPAVGAATFTNLQLSNNHRDIENPTSTFTITRN
ncbi:discoidin domain-containing protein [Actinoplanes xinjiangensis]|uniref:CARDB protein n=1 Tax=Actinoplanes xinjiangensis TaxID=512350 RepID=A0A316GAC7_9ACTN|nr:discoidin domain-containing protein [Actinoplanes xinjiangensis]PWK51457.1 CARDB protein [Actinoplanes xinjiangensis]GIF35816.1 glycosyl hydrolase [Actinoplanes xinjiangensis]